MKKSILKIFLIIAIIILGIIIQKKSEDFITIVKISNATKEITQKAKNIQIRVVEKYNDGAEKISDTYIKDGIYVTRKIDAKNTPSNSLTWTTTNNNVICNYYYEYEFEYNDEIVKGLNCVYNNNEITSNQSTTRLATGNLFLMYDKDNPYSYDNKKVTIFNVPEIDISEYNGIECFTIKTEYKKWFVEKETLRTLAIECKLYEDDSPYLYTFEYDIDIPDGIFEAPNPEKTYYNKVEFFETIPYQENNEVKEFSITGTDLKPGEELIELIELKDEEKLNFLGLTENEFGLNGINIYTLDTYNKFREKYSGLRELTKDDLNEYFVAIVYKNGYKLNHIQTLDSKVNNYMNYVFDIEKNQKESLVLIVSPRTDDSLGSRFINNKDKLNITEEEAIKLSLENINELNIEELTDISWSDTTESAEIIILDNKTFAGLEVIKTPVKGKTPICWKIIIKDKANIVKMHIFIDAITGKVIGAQRDNL